MAQLYFGNDKNIDFRRSRAVLKVQRHGFLDVGVEFIHGSALCENILTDAAGTPGIAVVINFYFYKHRASFFQSCYRFLSGFAMRDFDARKLARSKRGHPNVKILYSAP
jgi:hypothetical protein